MSPYTYCLILSIIFMLGTLYFVKARILDFRYSILWISISAILLILSTNKNLTGWLARMVGISYAPAFLFVTGIVFIFFLIFYLTIVISRMQDKIVSLVQEIGILSSSIEKGEFRK